MDVPVPGGRVPDNLEAGEDPAGRGGWRNPGATWLTVAFAVEVLVMAAFRLPTSQRFDFYAFVDQGVSLTVQHLLDRGERPTIDFGYHYGLLPLTLGRVWFRVAGRTPAAYLAAMTLCNLLMAWGLARFATAARVGPAGLALLVVAMPIAVRSQFYNPAHALEAVLLCHALAEQARGRRGVALALATAGLFVKPAMPYVLGLLFLIFLGLDLIRRRTAGPHAWARALAPAAVTGVALAALVAGVEGVTPLVRTLLPLSGAENYKAMNYGFFRGSGRDFWLPPHTPPTYYLGQVAGFWLVGTLCLVVVGLAAGWRLARGCDDETRTRNAEVLAACAGGHAAFVLFFFGNPVTWIYYSYILVMGLAATAPWGRPWARACGCLAVVALLGQKVETQITVKSWATTAPHAETAGLWVPADELAEWREVLRMIRGRQTALLVPQGGGAELLFPGVFAPPLDYFLNHGLALPGEVRRKVDQVAAAPMVLVPQASEPAATFLGRWPEFRAALDGCELALDGRYFKLYRRTRPPRRPLPEPRT